MADPWDLDDEVVPLDLVDLVAGPFGNASVDEALKHDRLPDRAGTVQVRRPAVAARSVGMPKRRDLIRMSDDEIDEFLHGRRTMNVATFNHDGTIHLVAMWYGFYEGKPAFETFAKSQKVLNVQRDSRITVLVEDGDQYEELRGVEIVGTGRVVEDPAEVMKIARDVVRRYIDVEQAGGRRRGGGGDGEQAVRHRDRTRARRELGPHQARRPVLTGSARYCS